MKEEGGPAMVDAFDRESETPELIWDEEMRSVLRASITEQLDGCLDESKGKGSKAFSLPPGFSVKYSKVEDEIYIGGVYVKLFLKKPTFNLRDPTSFLEILMKRWSQEVESTPDQVFNSNVEDHRQSIVSTSSTSKLSTLQYLTNAVVCICKVQSSLLDKLAQWGYMERLISFMQRMIHFQLMDAPLISIIRVLHVSSSHKTNVEAISTLGSSNGKNGVVDYLLQAIGSYPLHADSDFILNVLQDIFKLALGNVENVSKGNEQEKQDVVVEEQQKNSHMNSSEDKLGSPPLENIYENSADISGHLSPSNACIQSGEDHLPMDAPCPMPLEPPPPLPSEPPPPPPLENDDLTLTEDHNIFQMEENVMGLEQNSSISFSNENTHESFSYTPAPILGGGIDATSDVAPSLLAERQTVSIPGAPGSINGRTALLQSALECLLPQFLVEKVLENPTLENVKDPAAAKVHAIAILKLLTIDPGYGMKFNLILDCLPDWKKYKS